MAKEFITLEIRPKENLDNIVSTRFLWGMGFRPFFWGGSIAAILLIGCWTYFYARGVSLRSPFVGLFWHGHEMVFGFVAAIIAGFLLTASANWTGTRGLHGFPLKLLFLIWVLGRILIFTNIWIPQLGLPASIADLCFLPALILVLAPPLVRAKALRNILFIFLLSIFWLSNLLMHLAGWNFIDGGFLSRGLHLGVNIIVAMIIVIGGRVVPFFTANRLPQAGIKKIAFIEIASFALMAIYVICDFWALQTKFVTGTVAALLGIISLVRLFFWRPQFTFREPLLLILHLGYFWLGIGFLLIASSHLWQSIPYSVAVHAFTVGGMGTFIIGMISRVSLGHSGRALRLAKGMLWSYILINMAAVVRIASVFLPFDYRMSIIVASFFWILAFGILLSYYSKIYLTPRADGREG